MELTRRDAVAALAAVGAAGGVAVGVRHAGGGGQDAAGGEADGDGGRHDDADGGADEETVRSTMVAVAAVVYPDAVSNVEAFVDRFLDGRLDGSAHAAGLREAVADLEAASRSWYDAPVAELSAADREELLRGTGADTAEEDPDGTTAERVRYYVVNDLLLALYASPTGGELVGIENPQGHPGGAESYRRGPK
ncbi:Gluconate 2-dehydrogenase subunit 3 [Halorubrum aquaticum]|uniref:Gluconate 2-dehydrogenase subunit 3 n=1 Tax=Halorubrum aquaticum TaxID=387340 RepID=A0A1I3CGH3_9EURY|nr:gluconate 2-dehydrogenase subunit 3 family protein [Halorubrum aquaticum]SFH73181.1 Gluconate 2-dehydrogenase subunit 3 [Halorubrum aquaticum]